MCRLFGLHAGTPVDAEFWLLEAPDSLAAPGAASAWPISDGPGPAPGRGHSARFHEKPGP
jgi:hypothetical protein